MAETDLMTYPYIRKEKYEELKEEIDRLRVNYDLLFAEFNQLKSMLDNGVLNITKIINLCLDKGKEEDIKKVKQELKELSNIGRLSELISTNISFKVMLNEKQKIIDNLNAEIAKLQKAIASINEDVNKKLENDKKSIYLIRNIDEIMKQKLKEHDELEIKNKNFKELNEELSSELNKRIDKLGYNKNGHKDYKKIDRKIYRVQRLINKGRNEKAKKRIADINQMMFFLPENDIKKKHQDSLNKIKEALDG